MFHHYEFQPFGSRSPRSAVRALIVATVAAFGVQWLADGMTGGAFTAVFSLSRAGLRRLWLWQPVSYQFLHGNLLHLLLNLLGLFFFGPETERALGSRRFLMLYLVSGALGGLGWIVLSAEPYSRCVGASGAVFGVLGAFAALFPNRPVTLLVFFVIPVTMRARTLAIGLGLFSLLAMVSRPGHIADAAHLVGGLAGYLCGLNALYGGLPRGALDPRGWWNAARWHWQRRRFKVVRGPERAPPHAPPHAPPTSEEVDAVLDTLSKWGFGALTDRERNILERASRRR